MSTTDVTEEMADLSFRDKVLDLVSSQNEVEINFSFLILSSLFLICGDYCVFYVVLWFFGY